MHIIPYKQACLLCLRDEIFWKFSEDGKEATNSEAPENNPQFTTVYVGNLAPEVMKCQLFIFYPPLPLFPCLQLKEQFIFAYNLRIYLPPRLLTLSSILLVV